jgi:hypothetical protein
MAVHPIVGYALFIPGLVVAAIFVYYLFKYNTTMNRYYLKAMWIALAVLVIVMSIVGWIFSIIS